MRFFTALLLIGVGIAIGQTGKPVVEGNEPDSFNYKFTQMKYQLDDIQSRTQHIEQKLQRMTGSWN